jgi:hypothetical protein
VAIQEPFKQKFAYVPDPKGDPVFPDGHDPTGFIPADEAKSLRKKKKLLIDPVTGVPESAAKRKKRKKLQAEGIETDREIPPNRRGAVQDGRIDRPRNPGDSGADFQDDERQSMREINEEKYRREREQSEGYPDAPRNPGDSRSPFGDDERRDELEYNKEKERREREQIEGLPGGGWPKGSWEYDTFGEPGTFPNPDAPRNPGDSGADFQDDERQSMREINEEKYRREQESIEGVLPPNSPVPPRVPAPTGGGSTTIYESPLPPGGVPRESGTPEVNSGLFGHYSW